MSNFTKITKILIIIENCRYDKQSVNLKVTK